MILPLILLTIAILSAATAVYGTLPQWSLFHSGIHVIETTRQLQWPLLTLSVLMCVAIVVSIIIGKRRVWWLIGFAPVLALFAQLFVTGTFANLQVVDHPPAVSAADATSFMKDDEYVVGLVADEQTYAFPYRQLFSHPVVVLQVREKQVVLMWNAFANRAVARSMGRQVVPRELEVVSMPSNALLIYNTRVGQFINGLTGLTPEGTVPGGFHAAVPTAKMTWGQWRGRYPQTLVMSMPALNKAPAGPIRPRYPMRVDKTALPLPAETQVLVFATTRPVAVAENAVTEQPINVSVGDEPVVVFRDPASGRVKAFERTFDGRSSRFLANPSLLRAVKGVFMLDAATNSGWTSAGVAVDGEKEVIGKRLQPVAIEEGLYFGVMREWYPEMELVAP